MRFFYVKQIKPFIIAGACIAILTGFLLRLIIPQVGIHEIMFHTNLRNILGHPFVYYSPLSLIILVCIYEYFYAVIGALFGFFFFLLKHRHSGFTAFFTRSFKTTSLITFLLLFYLFLRIDLVNPYDTTVMSKIPHPNTNQIASSGFIKTLAALFLPSLHAIPERGFPEQANQITQHSIIPADPPQNNTAQTPVAPPQTNTHTTNNTYLPLPTAQANPLPPATQMPSATQLLSGLNSYRSQRGLSTLAWDQTLADFANEVAEYYTHRGSIDGGHYFNAARSQDPFAFGFQNSGEMSSYGVTETATGFFTNYFASFASTNIVQSSPDWQYVGIGVNGTAVEIIFGARKCASTNRHGCQ